MNAADQDRLNRIRKQLGAKWDEAAGETTAEFLLRLLNDERERSWTAGYNAGLNDASEVVDNVLSFEVGAA